MQLRDIEELGQALGSRLSEYRVPRPIVLALPPGGVPIAQEIAQWLGAELEMVQAEGLVVEGYRGAVAETGEVELDSGGVDPASEERLAGRIVDGLSRMLLRRVHWLPGSTIPRVAGRVVILVADGLATGARMRAALRSLRARDASRIVAVALAATEHSISRLKPLADDVVCLMTHSRLASVGRSLRKWRRIPDETACRMLRPKSGWRRAAALEFA
jgi:predicted phosphoribosyltransferase